jgi:hypothetical protein
MDQIRLNIPDLPYKNVLWENKDNVTDEGRATAFESQNKKYHLAGYTAENTKYKQAFPETYNFINFSKTLFDRCTIALMQQAPGQVLPEHVDTFYMFAKHNNVHPDGCIRVNIFLEDWQSGHYFEINKTPITNWKRGDAVIIEKNEPHLSSNSGMSPKYTMQITGVKNEFKRR